MLNAGLKSDRVRSRYSDRIPVICEKEYRSDIPQIDKIKYLVPNDLTVGQFNYVIRKRIKLPPEKAMFLFVNNVLPPTGSLISEVYDKHQDLDGFLYFFYSGESVFGMDFGSKKIEKQLSVTYLRINLLCK